MNRFLTLGVVSLALTAVGCERQGPAERAGEQIDQAVDDARDTAAAIGEELEEAADDVADELN